MMLLDLRGVTKTYARPSGPTFTALSGVTLGVSPGELVAVVGRSGSGKSTLLNLIAGLDRPTAGEVRVAGAKVHTMSEDALAVFRGRSVGVVFQFFQLLPTLTVLENVLLAMDLAGVIPRRERPDRARRLVDLAGLADHAGKLPSALSGGQQQRAAIARALANDPPLLLADEPTGNLDSQAAADVVARFEGLVARGTTVLVVTHDEEVARRAHRVVRLADGAVVEDRALAPGGAA